MNSRIHRLIRNGGASIVASLILTSPAASAATPAKSPDAVVAWNRILLTIQRTAGAQPATQHATRDLAILSAAQYDAIVPIAGRYNQYRTHLKAKKKTSAVAAAVVAAHDALVALYPASKDMLDSQESTMLAPVPSGIRKQRGTTLGKQAARAILALRSGDGADATPLAYTTTGMPGDYAPTPPAFAAPAWTHWSAVAPWTLRSASQFRPPAPPTLKSDAWTRAYQEVQSLGSATSTTRTDSQTQQAKYWAAPIQNYWNEIAQTTSLQKQSSLAQNARIFAELNIGLADDVIAFYDAKYHYRLWRPVTAIRAGEADGNPATAGDPNWLPLGTTPADPSYPGAHSVVSTTAAAILSTELGAKTHFTVSSEVLPGVQRSFTSFSAAATEAGLSRIYAGVHTRIDADAGVALGRNIGKYVLNHVGQPKTGH
jgi:hypothetical protein